MASTGGAEPPSSSPSGEASETDSPAERDEARGPDLGVDVSTAFTRPIALTETAIDDELVVTDLLTSRSFTLNPAGVTVWRELGTGRSPAQVAGGLVSTWPMDVEEATEIVVSFARDLFGVGLLHTVEETPSGEAGPDSN